ncbi:MAG: hypothetical protein WCO93_10500 [bacterium]
MKRNATMYYLTSKGNGSSSDKRRKRHEMSPSESVIRNILNYSKALSVFSTPETGIINLVMN